jgi:hypothetical protein
MGSAALTCQVYDRAWSEMKWDNHSLDILIQEYILEVFCVYSVNLLSNNMREQLGVGNDSQLPRSLESSLCSAPPQW